MFWQANSAEQSLFRLFSGQTKLAEFAYISKEIGIGKITDAAIKQAQILIFKTDESKSFRTIKVFDPETKKVIAEIELDVSKNGKLRFADEKNYEWSQISWTSFDRIWKNESADNFAVFELNNPTITENFVGIKISPKAGADPNIYFLMILGWALIVKEKSQNGVKLLAEGNPQEFLSEDKIKNTFGIDFSAKDFNKQIVAAAALTSVAVVDSSNSGIDMESAIDVIDVGLDIFDLF